VAFHSAGRKKNIPGIAFSITRLPGSSYQPQYLTQAEYQAIIGSGSAGGGGRGGYGPGPGSADRWNLIAISAAATRRRHMSEEISPVIFGHYSECGLHIRPLYALKHGKFTHHTPGLHKIITTQRYSLPIAANQIRLPRFTSPSGCIQPEITIK